MSATYDRFTLEEEIQNVWQTKEDLNAVTERIMEDTVFMSEIRFQMF